MADSRTHEHAFSRLTVRERPKTHATIETSKHALYRSGIDVAGPLGHWGTRDSVGAAAAALGRPPAAALELLEQRLVDRVEEECCPTTRSSSASKAALPAP